MHARVKSSSSHVVLYTHDAHMSAVSAASNMPCTGKGKSIYGVVSKRQHIAEMSDDDEDADGNNGAPVEASNAVRTKCKKKPDDFSDVSDDDEDSDHYDQDDGDGLVPADDMSISESVANGGVGGGKAGRGKKSGSRKHFNNLKEGVRKTRMRKIAKRARVRMCRTDVHDVMHTVMVNFVKDIVRDACIIQESSRRKTLDAESVIYALEKNGRKIYFGQDAPKKDTSVKSRVHAAKSSKIPSAPVDDEVDMAHGHDDDGAD